MEEEEFNQAKTDTFYLQRHNLESLIYKPDGLLLKDMVIAATVALANYNKAGLANQAGISIGFRNLRSQPEKLILKCQQTSPSEFEIEYVFDRNDNLAFVSINNDALSSTISYLDSSKVGLITENLRKLFGYEVFDDANKIWIGSAQGDALFTVVPTFIDPSESVPKGSLVAPMPGTITKILVEENDSVKHGQDLVIIEAMKMENKVVTPLAGVVTSVTVKVGDQVSNNQLLAIIQEDE